MKRSLLLLAVLSSGCLLVSGLLSKECNDGFIDKGEDCEDDNDIVGDGCNPGCQQEVAEVTTEEINGLTPSDARFIFFDNDVIPLSIKTDDGVVEIDENFLRVVISDRADLCEQLAADANALTNLPDLQAIKVDVIRRAPAGQSEFLAGETLRTNTSLINAAFGEDVSSIFVGATIFIRTKGVDQVLANTPSFAENDGAITFIRVADTIEARMSVTLTAERVAEPFDAQDNPFDQDQTLDLRTIDSPVSLFVKNVARCSAL